MLKTHRAQSTVGFVLELFVGEWLQRLHSQSFIYIMEALLIAHAKALARSRHTRVPYARFRLIAFALQTYLSASGFIVGIWVPIIT